MVDRLDSLFGTPATAPGAIDELLCKTFAAWKDYEVSFVILRNYDQLPHDIGNDLDVLVGSNSRGRAESLLIEAARSAGFHLHNRAEFSPTSLFFFHEVHGRQIHIDLFSDLNWRGFTTLPTEVVLLSRIRRGPFYIPDPLHESILNLLNRLLYQGQVRSKYREQIVNAFGRVPNKARELLASMIGKGPARDLVEKVLVEDWRWIEHRHRWLRFALVRVGTVRQPLRTLRSLGRDARRLAKRYVVPPGLSIAVCGGERSERSVVAAGLAEDLGQTFTAERTNYSTWLSGTNSTPGSCQRWYHSMWPGSRPGTASPAAYFIRALIAYWIRVRPTVFRNGLYIIHDFPAVSPKSDVSLPRSVRGILHRLRRFLVPMPDLVIFLSGGIGEASDPEHESHSCELQSPAVKRDPIFGWHYFLVGSTIEELRVPMRFTLPTLRFLADRVRERNRAVD